MIFINKFYHELSIRSDISNLSQMTMILSLYDWNWQGNVARIMQKQHIILDAYIRGHGWSRHVSR